MKYVIIGNSTAGIAAVEGIRSVDKKGAITVVSDEKHPAYGRPTISYCLKGDIKRENMRYRTEEFYKDNGVKLLLGTAAESIDAEGKCVTLSGGKKLPYDKLLLAVGSRPFVPKTDGLERVKRVYGFMTYDDMEALDKAVAADKAVLVVGAGLIGLKCVEGIADRVAKITVVDLADRVLSSVLDKEGAAYVQNKLSERGVEFILNDCVEEFSENNARLKSGKEVAFDILVIAVGVTPNTELFKATGGECGRGIVVNTRGETSVGDIYAAGDCAEGYDSSTGKNRVLALLPNAYYQGKCAGVNMAGGDEVFDKAIPMNAVGFFGLHIVSAGIYEGECIGEISSSGYKKLFVKDGKLAGYIIIGDVTRAGIYTALVREKTPLDTLDAQLIFKAPQLMAFDGETRRAKLARRV